jgi:hypothetical protein
MWNMQVIKPTKIYILRGNVGNIYISAYMFILCVHLADLFDSFFNSVKLLKLYSNIKITLST